ncbi:MAG: hypothetical protein ACYSVY_21600 [Planctomycetota bacterium]
MDAERPDTGPDPSGWPDDKTPWQPVATLANGPARGRALSSPGLLTAPSSLKIRVCATTVEQGDADALTDTGPTTASFLPGDPGDASVSTDGGP